MGFQDILLDILDLKRGARFVFVACSWLTVVKELSHTFKEQINVHKTVV